MKRKMYKLMSMLLAVMMVITMMPMTALASDGSEVVTSEIAEEIDVDVDEGDVFTSEDDEIVEMMELEESIVLDSEPESAVNEEPEETDAISEEVSDDEDTPGCELEESSMVMVSEDTEVIVGGVSMANNTYLPNGATKTQSKKPASGGYAHYKDGVLTLDNYEYEGDRSSSIRVVDISEIVLIGNNKLVSTYNSGSGGYGLNSEDSIIISGTGKLSITARNGIYVDNGDLNMQNVDIYIDAVDDGIDVSVGNLFMNDCYCDVDIEEADYSNYSYAAFDSYVIENSTLYGYQIFNGADSRIINSNIYMDHFDSSAVLVIEESHVETINFLAEDVKITDSYFKVASDRDSDIIKMVVYSLECANSSIKAGTSLDIDENYSFDGCTINIESDSLGINGGYGVNTITNSIVTIDSQDEGIYSSVSITDSEVAIKSVGSGVSAIDTDIYFDNSNINIESEDFGIDAGNLSLEVVDCEINIKAFKYGIYGSRLYISGNSSLIVQTMSSVEGLGDYCAICLDRFDEEILEDYSFIVSEDCDGTNLVDFDIDYIEDYDYVKIDTIHPADEVSINIKDINNPVAMESAVGNMPTYTLKTEDAVVIKDSYWCDNNLNEFTGTFEAKKSYYAAYVVEYSEENKDLPTGRYFDVYINGVKQYFKNDSVILKFSADGEQCTIFIKRNCVDIIYISGISKPKVNTTALEAPQDLELTTSIPDLKIKEYKWCEGYIFDSEFKGVFEKDSVYYLAVAVEATENIQNYICTIDGEIPIYNEYLNGNKNTRVFFIPVEPVELASIKIVTPPVKTTYAAGETFESEGMVVKAVYEDGSELEVTDYTLPTGELFAGDASVTISYTLCGVTKTASQAIRVDNKTLKALVIEEEAYKISYFVGETFDTDGMVVKAIYSDDSEAVISKYTVTPSGALTEADEKVTISYTVKGITHSADQPIEVAPDGLWIKDIEPVTYTGKALTPEVEVYYGHTLLTSKDYTVSYKNNTNAATADAVDGKGKSIAPVVIIKGKGNFTGSVSKTFTIEPLDLSNYATNEEIQSIVSIEPVYVKHTGEAIYATPVFKVNGKAVALKAGQYILEYSDEDLDGKTSYQDCGEWNITVKGTGRNFVGETTVTQTISAKLLNKVSITLDKSSYPYNAETGETYPATVTVKDGKTELTEDVHYTVEYLNQDKVGTATVIVTGIGEYSGIKTKTYKITGTKLSSSMVKQLEGFTYSGEVNEVENGVNYTIMNKETPLVEGVDYEVSYSGDQVNAGKFKVTFTGINSYTGSVTKTYTIVKVSAATLRVELHNAERVKYAKGGATPKPEVYFGDELLTEGVDYKISYSNNKKLATSEDAKAPGLYITGIGNFTGNTKSTPVKFTIVQADLGEYTVLDVTDVLYKDAKGNYVPKFTLKDLTTGKALDKKTDYSATYSYEIFDESSQSYVPFDGEKVAAPESRTKMRITVTGAGCYKGSIEGTYEIYRMNIASVKVGKIATQVYTGRAIEPELDITVKEGKVYVPLSAENYDIVYVNNVNKGTATAYIYGKGAYGGEKKVTFKITSQKMTWWESLFS